MNLATVTAASPLAVLSDGDTVEVPAQSTVYVAVGDRVLVEIINNTVIVVGSLNAYLWPAAGLILAFGGPLASIPPQTLPAIGGTGNRTTHARLFAVYQTTHGAGDGSTTFGLPDLQDRPPIGAGTFAALGATDGLAETLRTLRHTHPLTAGGAHDHNVSTGGGHSHNISSSGDHLHGIPDAQLPVRADVTGGGGSKAVTYSGAESHHDHSGTTGSNGSHDHTGAVGGNGDHDHGGTTGTTSTHDHGGETGQSAANASPYLAVNYVITT